MKKLCIFDLDGTTVNSLRSIAYFANATLARFGQRTFTVDEYRHLAGGGAKKLIRNLVTASGAPEELYEPMLHDWVTSYDADFMYLTEAYPGISEMLASLRAAGVHTAIVTNKHGSTADKIVHTLFGSDGALVEVCVSDHPGMMLKPAPDELLRLARRFGLAPGECAYCGDHGIDMRTGKNAGMTSVGVTWGFHTRDELLEAGADLIADTPRQITEYITGGDT